MSITTSLNNGYVNAQGEIWCTRYTTPQLIGNIAEVPDAQNHIDGYIECIEGC